MKRTAIPIAHVQHLLASGEWEAAALHMRQAAQRVSSRLEAQAWRELCQHLPSEQRGSLTWAEALAWVGFRADDPPLVRLALQHPVPGKPVFQAFLANSEGSWKDALTLLDGFPLDTPHLGGLAGRYWAGAQAALNTPGWEDAFQVALQSSGGRDRGLTWLDLAYYRSLNGQDGPARDAYAQASVWLGQDAWAQTLAHANLGISCLRINDLHAAEQALNAARHWASKPGGEGQLSTVWRVLGGLGLQRHLPARAIHAFRQARGYALNPQETLLAQRGLARALRRAGQYDQALTELHAAQHMHPSPALPLDVAALLLLTGNDAGASEALERAAPVTDYDRWRQQVVQAELSRRAGLGVPPGTLYPRPHDPQWLGEEARYFPEVLLHLGVTPGPARPRGLVNADGPVRLQLDGVEVPLKPHLAAASLLAFLAAHGSVSSAERLLDALSLPGRDRRAQLKELSRVARVLADVLGWREAVQVRGGMVRLTPDIDWAGLVYPPPERSDLFCEGRWDRWVLEWRQDNMSPLKSIS